MITKAQPTAGFFRIDDRSFEEGAKGTVIAVVEGVYGPQHTIRGGPSYLAMGTTEDVKAECTANAILLASAPRMLAALQKVAADFDGMVLMPPGLADEVRETIAEATREKP